MFEKKKDAEKLKSQTSSRFQPVILDVTNSKHISDVFDLISKQSEPLVGLINNAGVNLGASPVSIFPEDYMRKTFEVNFFGLLAMTQKFTPLLMQSKGRIIHISSVVGLASFPLMGIYSATKFSVEAIADAQRVEMKKHGVAVILVEPGVIITRLTENLENNPVWNAACQNNENAKSHFGSFWDGFLAIKPMAMSMSGTVSDTSKVIVKAFKSPKPYTRYLIGYDAVGITLLKSILPHYIFDFITNYEIYSSDSLNSTNKPRTSNEL